MSKNCDGSVGWGTILSLTANCVLAVISAGLAYSKFKMKSAEQHKILSKTILSTGANGVVTEERTIEVFVAAQHAENSTYMVVNTKTPSSSLPSSIKEAGNEGKALSNPISFTDLSATSLTEMAVEGTNSSTPSG